MSFLKTERTGAGTSLVSSFVRNDGKKRDSKVPFLSLSKS